MACRHGSQVGIEAKIEYHPALEDLGSLHEQCRITAVNWLQLGLTEEQVEKRLQHEFTLQWAWADSITTEANQCLEQLKSAKENQISQLQDRIKAKTKKAKATLKQLAARMKKAFTLTEADKFQIQLMGLKSKVAKIESLKRDLIRLESSDRLHICFGSRKLFNAQYHLEENGYTSPAEWLEEWRKKRSGRFYCVGKSQLGSGTMMKVFPTAEVGIYTLQVTVPRPLIRKWGTQLSLRFEVSDCVGRPRRGQLNYALECQKPITTQVFRREHKSNQWYIHLTTYVQSVPLVHTLKHGCLGVDFNANSLSVTHVKPDGNIAWCQDFSYKWKGLTSGQRAAAMRDLVVQIVRVAEFLSCAVAIESLDFSKKKARMSEESKLYNSMLSNLATSSFREALVSRCQRQGVQLVKINPAFTSLIGMIKFMARSGLNSGTAAAMAIARRAMRLSERIPQCLSSPEDEARHDWSAWNRVARFVKQHGIRRAQLFDWTIALEGILTMPSGVTEHQPSMPVASQTGESTNPCQSPKGEVRPDGHVQLCLVF